MKSPRLLEQPTACQSQEKPARKHVPPTPSFILELPLCVDWSNEQPLRAHLEAARCLYNALLSEANHRLQAKTGRNTVGLDIGPQTLAIVPQQGDAALTTFCEELAPNTRKKRRLQRKMDRQRRANNPDNYDEQGRVKSGKKQWHHSKRYQATRRQYRNAERKLAAHRKSLHGKLVHDIVARGNIITIEKTSFKTWQKQYGRSIGLRAPGLFVAHLTRIVAKTGGTLTQVSTFQTKLSQYCHQCEQYHKKSRSQRWHQCSCGCGPVQRDLYSAFLLAHLEPGKTIPSITQSDWEGAEPRLRAVMESLQQRANAGEHFPQSMGVMASGKAVRARARRLKSPPYPRLEPADSSSEEPAGSVE